LADDLVTSGTEFAARLLKLTPGWAREREIIRHIQAGRIPGWLSPGSAWPKVSVEALGHTLEFFPAPDVVSIGTAGDYLRVPLTPAGAQEVMDLLGTQLPTKEMSDLIFNAATVQLVPQPLTPYPGATSDAYVKHNALIEAQRAGAWGLVGGQKKDLVIVPGVTDRDVWIYGWHDKSGANTGGVKGKAIQGLSNAHKGDNAGPGVFVDYSHGARPIASYVYLDGTLTKLATVLAHPTLSKMISSGPTPSRLPHKIPSDAAPAALALAAIILL
jgi:hypothetical protein